MSRRLSTQLEAWRVAYWLPWAAVAFISFLAIEAVLAQNGGQPSVPLDDAYIHFQFARAFSRFSPFEYTEGAAPAAGATSLLWPLLLAPFFWFGGDGHAIIWLSWALGFLSLGFLVLETARTARLLLSPLVAIGSASMVLCFGGLVWLAASGMEAVPFAWLWLLSARKLAEFVEAPRHQQRSDRSPLALVGLSYLTPLMRPEGSIVPIAVAVVFMLRGDRSARKLALVAFAGVLVRPVCFWLGAGQTSSTTSLVKWLPNNPYLSPAEVLRKVLENLELLYTTLLNGELWSASVLPTGGAFLAWLALPALVVQAARKRRLGAGLVLLVFALGIWIPTTYESFLWNRLRYLWPFAPAWFIALGALCDVIGDVLQRYRQRLGHTRWLFAGALTAALLVKLPTAIFDLGESSAAIRQQQVSLGRWASKELAASAKIGVNDTGAIAYFSGRQTFDIVGLTTPNEGTYWTAGPGSRFEHYEQLSRSELPTHFIVYPEWFALEPLLGKRITERYVSASILGGPLMVAHEADYSSLGSAERPILDQTKAHQVVDALDVADIVSERAHNYALLDATQQQNTIGQLDGLVDGMRLMRVRDRFSLKLAGAELLVARLSAQQLAELDVSIDDKLIGVLQLAVDGWQELMLPLPGWSRQGTHIVEINAPPGSSFGAMHYWALRSQ